MKREQLKELGLEDSVIEKVMSLHGSDIETHKAKISDVQTNADNTLNQLTEANATIERFKALKPDELKAAADEYKTKYEQAQTDNAAQMAQLKFDYALDGSLSAAKVKNLKAIKPLLDAGALKYNESDNSIIGLKEQLEKVKQTDAYLFTDYEEPPRIVAGGNQTRLNTDAMTSAMRQAAGLSQGK